VCSKMTSRNIWHPFSNFFLSKKFIYGCHKIIDTPYTRDVFYARPYCYFVVSFFDVTGYSLFLQLQIKTKCVEYIGCSKKIQLEHLDGRFFDPLNFLIISQWYTDMHFWFIALFVVFFFFFKFLCNNFFQYYKHIVINHIRNCVRIKALSVHHVWLRVIQIILDILDPFWMF